MARSTAKTRSKTTARTRKAAKKAVKPAKKKAVKPAAKPVVEPIKRSRPKAGVMQARIKLFVAEYLKNNFNGTKAAIAVGYAPNSARITASELLALPEVHDQVVAAMEARAERTAIDTDSVLKRMHAISTADARDLIELYRCCCRFCWGESHHYQWTPNELREALAERQRQLDACTDEAQKARVAPVDEVGGTGFNPHKDPNPACPECFGEGVERVVAKDTRDLSPSAQLLYAGVKVTQHGLEIKTHDQTGMLVNVAKHLGMFEKKVKVSGEVSHHHSVESLLDELDGAGTGLPKRAGDDRPA